MKTPDPGSQTYLKLESDATLALHPWGIAPVRAWEETGGKPSDTPIRTIVRAVGRALYPEGKALARLRYFETQRGLALSVVSPAQAALAAKTGRKRAKAAPAPKRAPRLPYVAAAAAKKRMEPPFNATVNLPIWHELGPTLIPHGQTYGKGPHSQPSVSGRCVGIDIDPTNRNHLVVCSAGGGLWESQDGGATWRPLTDKQPTLTMGAVARAPSSSNIVYAATGEGDGRVPLGVGLLRSSDGGQTWTHVPSAILSGEALYDIAVHPTDPLHLWIGGSSALYESKDGGSTVHSVRSGRTWDFSINPSDPSEIFAGTENGLIASANGGQTWSAMSLSGVGAGATFDRIEICHAASNPAIVYVAASIDSPVTAAPTTRPAARARAPHAPRR